MRPAWPPRRPASWRAGHPRKADSEAHRLASPGKLDLTRASNADTGEALPRVAPLRLNLGLNASRGPWSGRLELDHPARQDRVPATDVATAGYCIMNLLSRCFNLASTDTVWFLKLGNLGDTLAYSASAIQTVRDLAPLPDRSVKTGIRVAF